MNSSDWTVKKVFDDPYSFNNEHGSFLVYRLFVSDGHEDQMVEWTRKADAFPPTPESVVHGTITQDGFYKSGRPKLKFKLGKQGDGAPSSGSNQGSGTTRAFNPPTTQQKFGNDDNRSKRIERQHSQEMAIRVLVRPQNQATVGTREELETAIRDWTDYFCADLDAYCNSINAAPNGRAKESLEDAVSNGKVEAEPQTVPDTDDIPF